MSSSILEKLKVKPVPKKIEQIQVKIVDPKKEETVEIKTKTGYSKRFICSLGKCLKVI